jgi:ectoine hydroxylase-related dioxygenase (phytanoyl-CoA dioxygenase family)
MDRVRWVKVFCYLTDVGDDNGPHAFVSGSHNTIQNVVTHDGRYSDAEVFAHYPRSSEVRLKGPAGTVFLEDTLGFHKGVPVESGRRGVFEFQYSINHYGYPHVDAWHVE